MRYLFLLLLTGCGGMYGPPPSSGAVGVVGTAVVSKVKEDIKDISELAPYLNVSAIEVCWGSPVLETGKLQCQITPCEGDNCERVIDLEEVDPYSTAYIKHEGWIKHAGEIKALCTSPHENFREACKTKAKDYSNIDTILLLGGGK